MNVDLPMRIGTHDRVIMRGVDLRWVAEREGGHVFRLADDPRLFVEHSNQDLWSARAEDRLEFDEGYHFPGRAGARLRSDVGCLGDIPQGEQALMARKFLICQGVVRLEQERDQFRRTRHRPVSGSRDALVSKVSRSDDGLRLAQDLLWPEVEDAEAVSNAVDGRRNRGGRVRLGVVKYGPQTIRKWLLLLEANDWDITALRMRYRNCGRRTPRLSLDCERLMALCAPSYASESRPSLGQVYDSLRVAIDDHNRALPPWGVPVEVPSKRTFVTRIRHLDRFEVHARRYGLKAALHRFRTVTAGINATRLGERVELDEAKLHLQTILVSQGVWDLIPAEAQSLIKTVRPWICVVIDCASRTIVGLTASLDSSTESVLGAIRMTVSDKSSVALSVGAQAPWDMSVRPSQLVTDNGPTIVNRRVRLALAGLRVEHLRTIAGEPSMRGTIERLFRTLGSRLLRHFTGGTFEHVVARGDYPAEQRASMTAMAIVQILIRHVVDDYHNRPHAGLGGETPADAWRRLAKDGMSPLPSSDALRSIFGVEVQRVIGPHGVAVFGLNYQSRALQSYHRSTAHARTVAVRVDCDDLGRVSARLGDTWVHLDCVSPGFKGKSLPVWRNATADLRRRFAAGAKISEPILLDAIRAAQAMSRQGVRVFGLTETWTTAEQLDRAQEKIEMGWIMPGTEAVPDLLADSVPAMGPDDRGGRQADRRIGATVEDDSRFRDDVPDALDDSPAVPDTLPSAEDVMSTARASNGQSRSAARAKNVGSSGSGVPGGKPQRFRIE